MGYDDNFPAASFDFGGQTVTFTASGTTVTETIGSGFFAQTLTFTQESGNASLYQLTPPHVFPGEQDNSGLTYAFTGIGGATVTETITGANETTVLTYSQVTSSSSSGSGTTTTTSTSGSYQLSSETVTFTANSASANAPSVTYSFTESGGSVTGMSETITHGSHSFTVSLPIGPDTVFTVGSSSVTESFVYGNSVETLVYDAISSSSASGSSSGGGSTGTTTTTTTTSSASTAYSLASITTQFIAEGSASTALDVNPYDRVQFTIAGGAVTAASAVGPSGKAFPLPSSSHVSYSLLDTGFVEATTSFGSHSSFVVYYDGSGQGTYTEIAHGFGSSVDLVGLKAQLAQLPSAITALI